MSTLADSFLADFEQDDEEDEEEQLQTLPHKATHAANNTSSLATANGTAYIRREHDDDDDDTHMNIKKEEGVEQEETSDTDQIHTQPPAPSPSSTRAPSSLSVLLTDGSLPTHLDALTRLMSTSSSSQPSSSSSADTTPTSTPSAPVFTLEAEYPFISASTSFAVQIDTELALVHSFLRSLYSLHYKELEQLVESAVEYARVVGVLGNFTAQTDIGSYTKDLQAIGIPGNIVLTITVTASSSRGVVLTDAQVQLVREACQTILSLDAAKTQIHSYLSSRMHSLAPNLVALLHGDTELVARMLVEAGGLKRLSEIPACNIKVLGVHAVRHKSNALSSARQDVHLGIIGQCQLIRTCPVMFREKVIRLLIGKFTLAARMDEYREERQGQGGERLSKEIQDKIQLWLQPPNTIKSKALPIPVTTTQRKKRRGGKRYRREKERYAITELQKQKNRMSFGKEELIDEYTGEEFGMIGQQGSGKLTVGRDGVGSTVQKLSKKLSRDMQRRLNASSHRPPHAAALGTHTQLGSAGGINSLAGGAVTVIGGANGGTASTISFTPLQGIELVNNERRSLQQQQGQAHYFSSSGQFVKVGGQQQTNADKKPLPAVPKF